MHTSSMAVCLLMALHSAFGHDPKISASFVTRFEQSGFTETPRFDETVRFCRQLADASPWITYKSYGLSPQGRELPILVADRQGLSNASAIRKSGRLVLWVQACIHPGEPEGKDAGMMLLRDIAVNHMHEELLKQVSIIFLPVVNPDGHERFSPYNRINQNGPKEMGWRTTAQNLNLNRDHVKADAPEMRGWLRLFSEWMPDFFIDVHTTNGADYQYVLTYSMETFGTMDAGLTEWQKNICEPYLQAGMFKTGHLIFPYVQFRAWHDPRSGLRSQPAAAMYSQGYTALRNRPGLLIETHMLKDYKTRVTATYDMIANTMCLLNKEHQTLQKLISRADSFAAGTEFRKQPFPLTWQLSQKDSVMVDFLGVDYKVLRSDLTGGPWFVYDKDSPRTFKLPWFNKNTPIQKVVLPEAYIIPVEWSNVIDRIAAHGVEMHRIAAPLELEVESYRFTNVRFRNMPYEGRHTVSFDQHPLVEKRIFLPGSVVIDMQQPAARLIASMLEPKSQDSFLTWGFFSAIFEQKEYAETYVMEPMAKEMLLANQSIASQFVADKEKYPEQLRDQPGMLNWFYSRTPYWDQMKDKYPVGRITNRAELEKIIGE